MEGKTMQADQKHSQSLPEPQVVDGTKPAVGGFTATDDVKISADAFASMIAEKAAELANIQIERREQRWRNLLTLFFALVEGVPKVFTRGSGDGGYADTSGVSPAAA
jgi:hypothetical protein